MSIFNYIITIHNKESLLPRVLQGVAACCSKGSKIIPVLDGCTDRSEDVVDRFRVESGLNVEKVVTPDVYEIRALNAGMARVAEGFVVTIQDDIILQEPDFEQQVLAFCAEVGPTAGVISPRHGYDIRQKPFLRQLRRSGLVPLIDECRRVTRPEEAHSPQDQVDYGNMAFRMVAGGSPMIIPERVWRKIGLMDADMAPLMWHDHEYCLRALQAGFKNIVAPLHFQSDVDWGTMRQKAKNSAWTSMVNKWSLSNCRYVWKKHGEFINSYNQQQGEKTWAWM